MKQKLCIHMSVTILFNIEWIIYMYFIFYYEKIYEKKLSHKIQIVFENTHIQITNLIRFPIHSFNSIRFYEIFKIAIGYTSINQLQLKDVDALTTIKLDQLFNGNRFVLYFFPHSNREFADFSHLQFTK